MRALRKGLRRRTVRLGRGHDIATGPSGQRRNIRRTRFPDCLATPHLREVCNRAVGYMRVSSDSDRQTTDLQRDALLSAGVDGAQVSSVAS